MAGWRIAALVLALAGYAVLSHRLMADMPERAWTVAALFGPLLAAVAFGGWKRRHWPTLAGCALGVVAVGLVWLRGGVDVKRLYVLQHAALHALMAWTFAITLRPGATPLITAVAARVHEHFTPEMQAYTRALTATWAGYFAGMIVVSLLIYAFAPWPWWSLYCNVITPLAAVALFVADFAWRRWRHPDFEPVTMARAIRAYRAATAR